ncbi:allophanate hydrolase subunit 1 [Staphylococcus massiliensis]|uniref:Carboxyltransferase domain-containing protein n=1 Tax=Staphylococcus massiliensis S46 TaxID=1229783 RepID=K9B151_9STAP|nr:allophanate hydrolase subunit 1 [Staphylococcus massiliensis]EKU48552.1 hypothetical protein C273_05055 [Staphylococcus massiliensis S46]MCG3400105.1 allophanate hydrolase subunit 1 [Staphylococcus massiliensis]MCG3401827.1 allophanate hydrolase subunit 1 [Staphylococcus massiliensis]MCG3413159.1 allophanate hydrolase subunit 1 [Staphylococcus massiliensis]POA00604.1 allophanate hydrolase subunit 1 [Staphylococcus massiliensis CCUG 55927]
MKVYSQGDLAIVVSLDGDVSKSTTEDLIKLSKALRAKHLPFIIEIVPTESDLLVVYDATNMIKHYDIESPFKYMKALIEDMDIQSEETEHQDVCEIPVVYGDTYGPDLKDLLNANHLTESEFVQLHTENRYFVSMMGYSPGFPYLTGLDSKLYARQTGVHKRFIPAGSVIIEGQKCGIVTNDTYGDWLVVGYTPVQLFDPSSESITVLKVGDMVSFKAVSQKDIELGGFKPCQS